MGTGNFLEAHILGRGNSPKTTKTNFFLIIRKKQEFLKDIVEVSDSETVSQQSVKQEVKGLKP